MKCITRIAEPASKMNTIIYQMKGKRNRFIDFDLKTFRRWISWRCQVFLEEQTYLFRKPLRARRILLSSMCKYKLGQAKEGPFPPWGRGGEEQGDNQKGAAGMAGSGASPQNTSWPAAAAREQAQRLFCCRPPSCCPELLPMLRTYFPKGINEY